MKNEITVTVNGRQVTAAAGTILSEIIRGEKPCGGHGKCGKCKVIAKGALSAPGDVERKRLSQEELARNVRLACLTYAQGDCEVRSICAAEDAQIVTGGAEAAFSLAPTFAHYGIAIDIGTTTLAARLYDREGTLLSQTTALNPQSQWGADVISRIEAALGGKADLLAASIREALNAMICQLAVMIEAKKIDAVVITGNTVMLSLLTEQSVEPFSHAPFDVKRLFGETLTAGELSLSALRPDTSVYLPPCISAFVGADITCALLSVKLLEQDRAMLVDIGTNGEMALWHDGKLTVCSTAAGPAFEGVGITMGMRGERGAIDRVTVEDGALMAHVIGEGTPVGICGSGLVDAVACLLQTEEIDETGYLEDEEITVAAPVVLNQKDLRMFQLAKSAIGAGLVTLIAYKKLSPAEIPAVYIAGGFGNYLSKENAAKIGLFPSAFVNTSHTVGNAALAGAAMLLLDEKAKAEAERITQNAEVLDLSTNATFSERYMTGMWFEEM